MNIANVKASSQLNREKTTYKNWFLALLKEGYFIQSQTCILENGKEVKMHRLQKDIPRGAIIKGHLNYAAAKMLQKKGFKIREIKQKSWYCGNAQELFFTDYKNPSINEFKAN